ncbi:hypothetical protein [Pseudochryseolinea flava]|uniref:Uncharacterized protein n=1 Tax=Pseudochryseolinea flava TaxID=2059302 RepID=A0A364Y1M2_9BACT|nr:hypothetical protein [Pseudochryseolinea flava]RAV99996.1 hypothetical protein DQQ10_15675 [Pseudochryseolinea flava]
MTRPIHDQKILFAAALRPFLEMIEHKKRRMDLTDWKVYVNRLIDAIINNPEQYLGQNLPSRETTTTIVLEIFSEVCHDVFHELT